MTVIKACSGQLGTSEGLFYELIWENCGCICLGKYRLVKYLKQKGHL